MIKWLRRENARGAHIYIRAAGTHSPSLIDDLTVEAIDRMKAEGFEPAVVVETSPNNFQAWLNHGKVLEAEMSTRAAKHLAECFGGDPSSADWRHFGRLAGFTNQKPARRLDNGLAPFVQLRKYRGHIYRVAADFLKEISTAVAQVRSEREEHKLLSRHLHRRSIRDLADFHADRRYCGDLHRADMAWASHAVTRGLCEGQIRDEILRARDLSKKGRLARQLDCAERTAAKAIATADQPD